MKNLNLKETSLKNRYYSDIDFIDFDNLELMFLYVDDYKQFKKFNLNLNAKFIFNYQKSSNTLKISRNPHYVKLYPDNINLKILCGTNGTGKSTIINILKYIEKCPTGFVVYKNFQNHFVTNNKGLKIKYEKSLFICNKGEGSINGQYFHLNDSGYLINLKYSKNYVADFCRTYLQHYKTLNTVIHDNYKRFFNYFSIDFNNIDYYADCLESSIQTKYNIPINSIEGLSGYIRKNPAKFIMLFVSNDSALDILHQKFINSNNFSTNLNKNVNDFFDKILINIYGNSLFKKIEEINEQIIDLIYDIDICQNIKRNKNDLLFEFKNENSKFKKFKKYKSGYHINYHNKLEQISVELTKIYNIIYTKFSANKANINIFDFLYFNLLRYNNNSEIYFYNFSTGEQQYLITLINLFYKLVYANELAQTLIFEDDIDANLHPELCRRYIDNYINAINKFSKKNNKNKFRNIILTTHSPFILSDTTNDYIEYLDKDHNNTTNLRNKKLITNTFASNILQMFEDNMFMESAIGEYSSIILKEIVNFLNGVKNNKPILLKNNLPKSKKIELCKLIINTIGDKILKSILNRKINEICKNEKD